MTAHKEISSKDFGRYKIRILSDGNEGYVVEQQWNTLGSSCRIVFSRDEFAHVYSLLSDLHKEIIQS